jgi:hypothetical protein
LQRYRLPLLLLIVVKNDSTSTGTTSGFVSTTSVVIAKYTSAITISTSRSSITLKSNETPAHIFPYWGVGNAMYEAPSLQGQTTNPGIKGVQNYSMTIHTMPTAATTQEATSLGL